MNKQVDEPISLLFIQKQSVLFVWRSRTSEMVTWGTFNKIHILFFEFSYITQITIILLFLIQQFIKFLLENRNIGVSTTFATYQWLQSAIFSSISGA